MSANLSLERCAFRLFAEKIAEWLLNQKTGSVIENLDECMLKWLYYILGCGLCERVAKKDCRRDESEARD